MTKELRVNYVKKIDCLDGLKEVPEKSIDVIYLDPPFYTQRVQKLTDKKGNTFSFEDKWDSIEDYIDYLRVRFKEMHRVLKDTGSIFCHCDRKASHYIRVLLDEVFGYSNFQSEIIWTYRRWSNSKQGLLDSHQNIYYYSKTKSRKFNVIYTDYSATTNIDQILQERERNENGKSVYKTRNGEIVSSGEKKGVPLSDVWDIPFLNPKAKERTGYPTQKPMLLLDRILEISSDEGDMILDPFCGSGTSLVSAKLLNRKYIGFDTSEDAIKISKERLGNPIKTKSVLLDKGLSFYDTKTDFEKSILAQFDCDIVQRNKGLDGVLRKQFNNSSIGIKIQRKTETLKESTELLKRAMQKKKFEYSVLIQTHLDVENENIEDKNIIVIPIYNLQLKKELNIPPKFEQLKLLSD